MTRTATRRRLLTVADLLKDLGDISPERIRLHPPPGKATEKDVTSIHDKEKRLYELIDGVLVEKDMGLMESYLALDIAFILGRFLVDHDLGLLAGADGTMKILPGLVRIPDVSFVSWDRFPGRKIPTEAIPDLAVEVLSKGNTKGEMKRKVRDYLDAGCRLIWLVDPRSARSSLSLRKVRRRSKRQIHLMVAWCCRASKFPSAKYSKRCPTKRASCRPIQSASSR